MNLHDMYVPEFSGHVDERIETVLENGEAVYESANFGKNGSIIPIEFTPAFSIQAGGS